MSRARDAAEVSEIADRLHSASIHLLREARAVDPSAGIGPAQLSALSVIVFGGERSIGALAREEQVTAPTMTRIVDALVAAGLLVRDTSGTDRRSVLIRATARGTRLLGTARRRRVDRLSEALAALNAQDLETLAAATGILTRLFGSELRNSERKQPTTASA